MGGKIDQSLRGVINEQRFDFSVDPDASVNPIAIKSTPNAVFATLPVASTDREAASIFRAERTQGQATGSLRPDQKAVSFDLRQLLLGAAKIDAPRLGPIQGLQTAPSSKPEKVSAESMGRKAAKVTLRPIDERGARNG